MQRFMFRKVEVWVVLLLLVCGIGATIIFGAIVLDQERADASAKDSRFGAIGESALAVAEVPETLRQTLKQIGQPDPTMIAFLNPPTDDPGGWTWAMEPGSDGLDGYLLLSRHAGDRGYHTIELVSLRDGEVKNTWDRQPELLLAKVDRRPEWADIAEYDLWKNEYFRYIHPYLTEAGEVLLKDHQSPLVMIGPCGKIEWIQDEHLFHHSTESDGEGGYWIPSYDLEADKRGRQSRYVDDAIAHLDRDGNVILKRSLSEIFVENGLTHLIFPASDFNTDPMHLNDIQPVLADGPHWKKGDLFLSFRTLSLVMLYRPATNKVVWMKSGPWISQHDVDILDDHRIAVFNNNAYDDGRGARVRDVSEPLIYDFDTDGTSTPIEKSLEGFKAATISEGLQDFTPSGHLIVEIENQGRLFIFNSRSEIVASFLNRAANGETYRMGWSRFIPQDQGDKALAALDAAKCPWKGN